MSIDDGRTVGAQPLEPLIPPIKVTRQERNRLILVAIAAFVLVWLLMQSWDALGPFILALVLGYLMLPVVDRLARFIPRVLAILVVYLAFIAAAVSLVWWLAPKAVDQIDQVVGNAPVYGKQVQAWTGDLAAWYNSLPISPDVRQSIEQSARNSMGAVGAAVQKGVLGILGVVSRTMGFVVGLVIIPFWLFYVLKDKERGIAAFNFMLPESWRADIWRIVRIINGVLSSYIRGQLILALVVGVATFIGMIIVGAPYALLLGLISGLTEIIPVVGPILGAIPGLGLSAFSGEGWVMVVKVLAVYVLVQQLENNLLVPKIQGDSVKLHPSIIMVSLVVGSQVAGLFGLIVAVPVAAILRDIYLYLYRRYVEGFTAREAEASVPSRQEEESPGGKSREQKELADEARRPGINSEDELIQGMDDPVPAMTAQTK